MDSRNRFLNQNGKPELKNSICVFMDVLGFKETQTRSFAGQDALADFQKFYSVIRRELENLNRRNHESEWELKVFTDNIVLGYPIWAGHGDHAEPEFTVAFEIADYQLQMAAEGFFVRGGLSVGSLFMDDYLAYGPALLEAHELEHTIARDPRIVLGNGAREYLERHFSFYSHPQHAPQNRTFLLDSDNQVFIHYLNGSFNPDNTGCEVNRELLNAHKHHIEKGLTDFASDPRVWAKYHWLATYHDYTLTEWAPDFDLEESLYVSKKLHRSAPVKLCPFLIDPRPIA